MIGVLASYAVDGRSGVAMRRFAEYEAGGVPFVWDSGAWSVFTGAAKVTAEDHTEWIQSLGETSARFVALDVIGDPDATLANYRDQRAAGVNVEPTLHYGEPLDQIDALLACGDVDWFNVGGIVGALARPSEHRNVAAFVAAVRRRLPSEVKIHALGCTHPTIARLVDFDAGDSTSWLSSRRARSLRLFDEVRGDWRRFRVATTSADVERADSTWIPEMRDTAWNGAYQHGAWLRSQYNLDPADLVDHPDFSLLLAASIESIDRFTRWTESLHGSATVVYLAGGISERAALALAHDRATSTTQEAPAP